ncbi:MAG: hypothetical protein IJI84_00640 [Clostridia bacterium]|nr:hypothetical protein [Clostridia bacterium]
MYTREQRIDIGKKIYDQELSYKDAMKMFNVARPTLVTYVNLYKATINAPKGLRPSSNSVRDYLSLIKKELIYELMNKDIELERLKKGYAVRGVGAKKVFVSIRDVNMK